MGRIGGEEFMLLLPDTQEAAAGAVAEQLRGSVADSPLLDGRQVTVSLTHDCALSFRRARLKK